MTDDDVERAARSPDYASALRSLLKMALLIGLLWTAFWWAWQQPFALDLRAGWRLARMPPESALPVPVQGVAANRIAATFGAPRGRDRKHAGVDIFAPRGTAVSSATLGVVTSLREGGLGGRQVWVLGPGRERYYYAHLDAWEPGVHVGDLVRAGEPIGRVGNSGNARGTPTHLHFGIYGRDGARDPLPLLRSGAERPADDGRGAR